jgi:hypothetical protein
LAHITASKLADEGGHSLPRLAKESQTTVAHDNAVRLAWGLARRCRVLLEEDGELIPIIEELECPRCRKARRLRESS